MRFDIQSLTRGLWRAAWKVLQGAGTLLALFLIVGFVNGFVSKLYELQTSKPADEVEVLQLDRDIDSSVEEPERLVAPLGRHRNQFPPYSEALVMTPSERLEALRPVLGLIAEPRSLRPEPDDEALQRWPMTAIRESDGKILWDEQQLFEFWSTIDGGPVRNTGDSDGYRGVTHLKPFQLDQPRLGERRPVIMLRRVLFQEDLLGKWEYELASEEDTLRNDSEKINRVEFLPNHVYRETRILQEGDDLFGEIWRLELDLKGTWVVKLELRSIFVYVEEAKVKGRLGCNETTAEEQRKSLEGLAEWEIEMVREEGIEIDPDQGLRFTLRKVD